MAAWNRNWNQFKQLLTKESSKNLNSGRWSLFHWVFWGKNFEIISDLVKDNRLDINKTNERGETILSVSVINGNHDVVKMLLKSPVIDVNKLEFTGRTPLFIACQSGNLEIVKTLLGDNRADVNCPNVHDGFTPLCLACLNQHVEIVTALVQRKDLDMNLTNSTKASPFLLACQKGNLPIVQILLNDMRVDLNQVRNDGETALSVASVLGHLNVVKHILASRRVIIWDPVEVLEKVRKAQTLPRIHLETERYFKRRIRYCPKIYELLKKYNDEMDETVHYLRKILGFTGNFFVCLFGFILFYSNLKSFFF